MFCESHVNVLAEEQHVKLVTTVKKDQLTLRDALIHVVWLKRVAVQVEVGTTLRLSFDAP